MTTESIKVRTIGIRAAPKVITFAIYDKQEDSVINIERLLIPAAFEVPDALKFVRTNMLDIIREYDISRAGIRLTEPSAQGISFLRIQLEGVIQEAFASSNLQSYFVGHISRITALLNIPRPDFKLYVEGQKTWPVEGWNAMSNVDREALLFAIGAARA